MAPSCVQQIVRGKAQQTENRKTGERSSPCRQEGWTFCALCSGNRGKLGRKGEAHIAEADAAVGVEEQLLAERRCAVLPGKAGAGGGAGAGLSGVERGFPTLVSSHTGEDYEDILSF